MERDNDIVLFIFVAYIKVDLYFLVYKCERYVQIQNHVLTYIWNHTIIILFSSPEEPLPAQYGTNYRGSLD